MLPILEKHYEVVWQNIEREDHVGNSFGYKPDETAVGTTNGAGAHNVQLFMLAADRTVVHALFGFWHPEDLARELRLGLELHRLWQDEDRSLESKRDMFRRLQLSAVRHHPAETFARSAHQGFDQHAEAMKGKLGTRDTMFACDEGQPIQLKPLNMIVHERMAAQAFVPFDEFDVERFVDFGTRFYDLNQGVDGRGKRFNRAANNAARQDAKFHQEVARQRAAEFAARKRASRHARR